MCQLCCPQITGDEVLSVNGTAFQDFTHQEALDTFKVHVTVKMLQSSKFIKLTFLVAVNHILLKG